MVYIRKQSCKTVLKCLGGKWHQIVSGGYVRGMSGVRIGWCHLCGSTEAAVIECVTPKESTQRQTVFMKGELFFMTDTAVTSLALKQADSTDKNTNLTLKNMKELLLSCIDCLGLV